MRSFHVNPLPLSYCRRWSKPRLPGRYRPATVTTVLEFRVLGPLEVVDEDGPVRLGGPRQRATLAILLLHANRVVPVERLADELYAGRPPVSAVTQVQRQVSELRRALGSAEAIETRPRGYLLAVRDDKCSGRR
jgi:DNA-binding SARP family transcriptional activator